MPLSSTLKKHPNEKLLFIIGFFGNSSFERAIWIIYLVSRGYSLLQIAFFQALLNMSMIIGELPTGLFGDRYGRKKSLIVGRCLIILYLASMLLANNSYLISLAFVMYGIGLTFISGSDEALLYDSLKKYGREDKSSKIAGRYLAIITIATSVAIGIGGLLQKVSWALIFSASILTQIIALLGCICLKEISFGEHTEHKTLSSLISETTAFLKLNPRVRMLFLGIAIVGGMVSLYYIFSQELFNKIGVSVFGVSVIYSMSSLISAFISIKAHVLEKKFSAKTVIIVSLCALAIFFLMTALGINVLIIIGFFAIELAFCILNPIAFGIINQQLPSEQRATLLSAVSFINSLIMSVLSLVLGYAVNIFDFSFLMGSIGFILILIGWICISNFFKKLECKS